MMYIRLLFVIFVLALSSGVEADSTYAGKWESGIADQPILNYYNAKGSALMGSPFDNGSGAWVYKWDFGPVQDYEGGLFGRMIVFDSSEKDNIAYAVRGNFYPAIFTNHSTLEFPLSDQFFTGVGEKQYFECGYLTWTEAGGTSVTLYDSKTVVDNADSGFSLNGGWSLLSSSSAYGGTYRRISGTPLNSCTARWNITVTQPGYYDVYVWCPQVGNAVSPAYYKITNGSGTANVTMNQRVRSDRWNRLGCYQFSSSSATIELSSVGNTANYVLADAVRIVGPVQGPDTTPPTTPVVTDDGTHTNNTTQLHASWESQDLESGIDHYEYAIGTTPADPGSDYIVSWTSTGIEKNVTAPVSLSQGQTYYFYVRAIGLNNSTSGTGASDGIDVGTVSAAFPTVTDDGSYTGDRNALHCSWSSSETNIARYEYSVGTSPYASDTISSTNIGTAIQVWVTGLNLTAEQTYYFTVRSYDTNGTPSNPGCSDGIIYRPAALVASIADALGMPNTTVVMLKGKIISALFSNRFYLKDIDGIRGIAVSCTDGLPEESRCDVTGTLGTEAGERIIIPGCITTAQP